MLELHATPFTEERFKDLADAVLRLVRADAAEVTLTGFTEHLTRFANNQIHQNVSEQTLTASVRVVSGTRVGECATSNLDPASLEAMVRSAEALAGFQPENPGFAGLAPGRYSQRFDAAVARTVGFTPVDRARAVEHVCKGALAQGLNAAGAFKTRLTQKAIANTEGLWAYQTGSVGDFQTVVRGDDSSGWASAVHSDAGTIDGEALAAEAVEKALRSKNPGDLEPGVYPVLLEPYAVLNMAVFLAAGTSGEDARQGRSFMSGREGQAVAHPDVTVWDDGPDAAGLPIGFDDEGMPKRKVTFLEQGRVGAPVYDRRTAAEAGAESTGHYTAGGEFMPSGVAAANVFMAPGTARLDAMLAGMERGVYVTRFHYVNRLDAKNLVITGMTRDGTFWVENGKIVRPLRNMRFTHSILDALRDVEAVGDTPALAQSWYGGGLSAPALRVGAFRFSGKTTF